MSHGQKTLLLWAAIILIIAYVANVNLGQAVTSILHAAQQAHQANSH